MTHWIYTTMRPDWLLEVDDAEHADLTAQGLVLAEINPGTGEVIGGDLYTPPPPATDGEAPPQMALDAPDEVTDDHPADDSRPTRSGG